MQNHAYLFVLVAAAIAAIAIIFAPVSFDPTVCTKEAKICPDGSGVSRVSPTCQFETCEPLVRCDGLNACSKGTCTVFPGGNQAYCFKGTDPCSLCEGSICEIQESFPQRIICKTQSGLTKESCELNGGRWADAGKIQTCYLKTKDANLPCTGSEQCESLCVTQNQFYTTGKCHYEEPFSGCAFVLENGVNKGRICA